MGEENKRLAALAVKDVTVGNVEDASREPVYVTARALSRVSVGVIVVFLPGTEIELKRVPLVFSAELVKFVSIVLLPACLVAL